MKKIYLFFVMSIFMALCGCKSEDGNSYPSSDSPIILTTSDTLYSLPNRNFVINAKLTDDLGLKSVKIDIPELFLDKEIDFSTDSLLKNYNLAYQFLAPADTRTTDKFPVTLTLTDVSGNVVSKQLNLRLDGDFAAPTVEDLQPADGGVIFKATNTSLNISFTSNDVTGIDSIIVSVPDLGIREEIAAGGVKTYSFNKTYSIPSAIQSYDMTVTTKDTFVTPNKDSVKVNFSVAAGLSSMYLVDIPLTGNINADVFGIPEYFASKNGDDFTFEYYADVDNKEIRFLGQEGSFKPNCFGLDANGNLVNSQTCDPIILPTKGYYTIVVNASNLSYTVTPYTPTSTPIDPNTTPMIICGSGYVGAGWDPSNMSFAMTANPANPYQLQKTLNLDGSDLAFTITAYHAQGWWINPFFRIDAHGVAPLNGGQNATYLGSVTGNYVLTLDTELQRTTLVKQ